MKVASCENSSVNLILDSSHANNVKSSLDNEVQKLWDLETIGLKDTDEVHDDLLDIVSFTGERYSVKLPWRVRAYTPSTYFYKQSLQVERAAKKIEERTRGAANI